MSYAPGYSDVVAPMVSPYTFGWSALAIERVAAGSPTSGDWEGNSIAAYFPILVPTICTVRRLWWANGSSVSASYNVDVGIYLDAGYKPGTRLISSGNTAQGTATNVQFVDVTDTVLAPGRYWLAMVCSSASATFFRADIGAAFYDAAVRFQQTSASPLPASATPVESTLVNAYVFGFATTASP